MFLSRDWWVRSRLCTVCCSDADSVVVDHRDKASSAVGVLFIGCIENDCKLSVHVVY